MIKTIYFILSAFFFQHLIRDYLQSKGVKDWYTTFAHLSFIPDTPLNNYIGMVVVFLLGCLFLFLALNK